MGLYDRGNSLAEYALPTTIGVLILIGSVATFHAEIANLFGNTLNSEDGAAGVTARPYSTLVDPSSVVQNFNDAGTRAILDQMQLKCSAKTGVCLSTTEGIETSGAVGTKKFLDKQMRRLMMALDDLLDKPGNESLKAKFRDLANIGYEIAELQRELARAMKSGDTGKIAELIAKLNGGSVTYRVDNGDGTYTLTTVSGDQSGSLIDQLRALRNEIMTDPRLGAIPGATDALDAIYDVLEYDALAASTLVDGAPPVSGASLQDSLKGNGDTSGTGQVVTQTTTGGTDASTQYTINNVLNLMKSDSNLANELLTLASKESTVKSQVETASTAYGKDSGDAADIILKAAKTLASDPTYSTASTAEKEAMLKNLLDDWEDGGNDTIDDDVAEDLLKDVEKGGSITSTFLAAADMESEKKALTTKINNTLISNGEYTNQAKVETMVDTATSDTTVIDSMTSGDTTKVTTAVQDTEATNAATTETETAAASTESSSNTTCSVGDGTTTTTSGASACIG